MWWEPEDERERRVREDVEHLSRWFNEMRFAEQPPAWGVGSVWNDLEGGLSPFVILNAARWPYSFKPGAQAKFRPQEVRTPLDEPAWRLPKTQEPMLGVAAYRPMLASTSVARLKAFLADQIYVRDYVICQRTGDQGTAGVRVRNMATGHVGLLTAGHVFRDGVGSEVSRRRWPRLGRLSSIVEFGRISHHVMPRPGWGDWDVAIIDVERAPIPATRPVNQLCGTSRFNRNVFAHGARSGFMSDAIVVKAALTDYGDDQYRWRNCWAVVPGGVLRPGDSGTAVFTVEDQGLLGVYVGSARTPAGRAAIHFVQDAESIASNVLANWGYGFF